MTDQFQSQLWQPKTSDELKAFYSEWVASYEPDMAGWGYATPARVALALRLSGANVDKPVLDFGCGTGLSGLALSTVGFETIDGTDISQGMLMQAEACQAYRQVWLSSSEGLGHIKAGDYPIIAATNVIGIGCAPAETLDILADAMAPGNLLAFSLDDATLADRAYSDRLDFLCLAPDIEVVVDENGPHLPGLDMEATVFVLRKT